MTPLHPLAREVGLVLGETRQEQYRRQRAVAAEVGIHHTALSRVECGHRPLSLREFFALCDALGVDASDIVRLAERRIPVIGCRRPISN